MDEDHGDKRQGQWNKKQEGWKGGIWVSEMVDRNFRIKSGFIQDLKKSSSMKHGFIIARVNPR